MPQDQLAEHYKNNVSVATSDIPPNASDTCKVRTGLKLADLRGKKQQMQQQLYYEEPGGKIIE